MAQGLSPALPLRQIASTALHSLPPQASALDALTLMAQHNIHHVPVLDGHTEAVSVRLTGDPSPEAVAECLAEFRGEPQRLSLPSSLSGLMKKK